MLEILRPYASSGKMNRWDPATMLLLYTWSYAAASCSVAGSVQRSGYSSKLLTNTLLRNLHTTQRGGDTVKWQEPLRK